MAQLKKYFPSDRESELNRWNIEKTKTVLELLRSNNKDDIEKILSFLEHSIFGWHEGNYWIANSCLQRRGKNCRESGWIYINSSLNAEKTLTAINNIFLDKKYGAITTYLFGYCIASLFGSLMKKEKLACPLFPSNRM